jgi:hypothetical protein
MAANGEKPMAVDTREVTHRDAARRDYQDGPRAALRGVEVRPMSVRLRRWIPSRRLPTRGRIAASWRGYSTSSVSPRIDSMRLTGSGHAFEMFCSLTSRSARNSLTVVASGWVLGFAAAAASAMAYCCAPCGAAKGLLFALKQKLDAVYAIVGGNESLSLAEGTDLIETMLIAVQPYAAQVNEDAEQ